MTEFPIRYNFVASMKHRTYPTLADYLDGTGKTQVELAELLGFSQAYVSKLVRRLQQPSLDEALRISRLTKVPVEALVAQSDSLTE